MTRPGTRPGLRGSGQRASGLGGAAALIGVALSLDGPSRLVGDAHRQLGDGLVGFAPLAPARPRQMALTRHEVRRRADACDPARGLGVLLNAVLDEAEPLPRDL